MKRLVRLEKKLIELNAPVILKLQPSIGIEEIEILLKSIGIISTRLQEFYQWKNGVKLDTGVIGELELFKNGIMLSLEDAIDHYEEAQAEDFWKRGLFPLFTSGGGDYLLLDTISDSKSKDMILFYSPTTLLTTLPTAIYDNLESLLETIMECYESGAYQLDKDGYIQIDFNKEMQISKVKNPNAEYWSSDTSD